MLISTLPYRSKSLTEITTFVSSPLLTMNNINGSNTSDPTCWTVDQVEEWLLNNHFDDQVDLLCHQHQISGFLLVNMKENQFQHLTQNQSLWFAIRNLQQFREKNAHRWMRKSSTTVSLPITPPFQYKPNPMSHFPASKPTIVSLEERSTWNFSHRTPPEQIEDQSVTDCCFIVPIQSDRKKTFLAFLLALSAICFCSFIITIVDERLPDPKYYPPLPDLILDNIQQISWAFGVTEKLILFETSVLIVLLLLHRHRMIILRRFFIIAAALYFLRSVTMLATSLPVATQFTDCQPKDFITIGLRLKKATLILIGQGMSSFGVKTCGDYLYSGHTCTLVLTTHFINEYSPRSYHLLHILSWISAISGMFFILAGHQHYSIDILIAWVLTSRLFIYYHTLANNRTFLRRDANRIRIWFPFFSYFEKNIKTAIPNEYCLIEMINNIRSFFSQYSETIRYVFYWIIFFLLIILMYTVSFTRAENFLSVTKR